MKDPFPHDYVYLKPLFSKAQENPKELAVSASFEALAVIGGYWRGYGQNPPPKPDAADMVSVPFWVVETLGAGWVKHIHHAPTGQTLGETLKLEGGGQGQRPKVQNWKRWFRDLRLAFRVAEKRDAAKRNGAQLSLENAFSEVATEEQSTEDIVRLAWRKNRQQILKALSAKQ